jgi:hypothetical protein
MCSSERAVPFGRAVNARRVCCQAGGHWSSEEIGRDAANLAEAEADPICLASALPMGGRGDCGVGTSPVLGRVKPVSAKQRPSVHGASL